MKKSWLGWLFGIALVMGATDPFLEAGYLNFVFKNTSIWSGHFYRQTYKWDELKYEALVIAQTRGLIDESCKIDAECAKFYTVEPSSCKIDTEDDFWSHIETHREWPVQIEIRYIPKQR
jgi:hypothetical protein